jgi:hypothetical protein
MVPAFYQSTRPSVRKGAKDTKSESCIVLWQHQTERIETVIQSRLVVPGSKAS